MKTFCKERPKFERWKLIVLFKLVLFFYLIYLVSYFEMIFQTYAQEPEKLENLPNIAYFYADHAWMPQHSMDSTNIWRYSEEFYTMNATE